MPKPNAVRVNQIANDLVLFRRLLHQHPELSLREFETTARIQSTLESNGLEVVPLGLPTGICAIVRGARPGGCIAIRADIDALPIVEQTGLPFASQNNGTMHACGHDFHTAAVLGAALLAKDVASTAESFAGAMLFLFQPAEEIGQGAKSVLDSKILERFQVGAILGQHNQPALLTGHIAVKPGPLMASVDEFSIVIQGVGGHAAIPEQTVDPILVAAHVVTGLQHLVSRTIAPLGAVVVTIGSFHAGTANNIIPGHAILEGTVRCLQPEYQDIAEERLRLFVLHTVEAFGATAQVNYRRVLPGVVNDARLAELVRTSAAAVVGEQRVMEATPSMAGEDFSLYQLTLPGCFFWVGTGKPEGGSQAWHHPEFDVDEAMIPIASQVFVETALQWLKANPTGQDN